MLFANKWFENFIMEHLLYFTAVYILILALIYSIQALLSAPNPDDPLSENIAKHWKSNEAEAVETGRKKH